jgi:acyl carrier protein
MEDKLKNLLSVLLDIDKESINQDSSSETIEGWDSLKQMNIVVAIEEEFNISFDEEESLLSTSYQSLLDIITKKSS